MRRKENKIKDGRGEEIREEETRRERRGARRGNKERRGDNRGKNEEWKEGKEQRGVETKEEDVEGRGNKKSK